MNSGGGMREETSIRQGARRRVFFGFNRLDLVRFGWPGVAVGGRAQSEVERTYRTQRNWSEEWSGRGVMGGGWRDAG